MYNYPYNNSGAGYGGGYGPPPPPPPHFGGGGQIDYSGAGTFQPQPHPQYTASTITMSGGMPFNSPMSPPPAPYYGGGSGGDYHSPSPPPTVVPLQSSSPQYASSSASPYGYNSSNNNNNTTGTNATNSVFGAAGALESTLNNPNYIHPLGEENSASEVGKIPAKNGDGRPSAEETGGSYEFTMAASPSSPATSKPSPPPVISGEITNNNDGDNTPLYTPQEKANSKINKKHDNNNNNSNQAVSASLDSDVPFVAPKDRVTDDMRRERAKVYAEALRQRLTKQQVPLPSAARIFLAASGVNVDDLKNSNSSKEQTETKTNPSKEEVSEEARSATRKIPVGQGTLSSANQRSEEEDDERFLFGEEYEENDGLSSKYARDEYSTTKNKMRSRGGGAQEASQQQDTDGNDYLADENDSEHNNRSNDADVDFFDGVRLEEYRIMYSMCSRVAKVGSKEFGPGIMYYFEFARFLGILTLILTALQIGCWAKFVHVDTPPFKNRNSTEHGYQYFISDFMITSYDDDMRTIWYGVSIAAIVATFLAAPVYFLLMQIFVKEVSTSGLESIHNTEGDVEQRRQRIVRFNTDTCDIDVSCYYRSRASLVVRRIMAVVILVLILGVQVVVSYFLTDNQEKSSFGLSMAISIISTTISAMFKFIAPMVTEFMLLTDYDWWKRWHTFSIISIRIGSQIAVFAAKDYAASAKANCTYDIIGEQLITTLLVEIFASPLMEILSAMLWRKNAEFIADVMKSRLGDQDNLYAWDLADYYRNILYRHFLTLMAMIVVPMVAALACVGYFLQFWVDKFLLYKMCGRPRRVAGSQKYFLTLMLFLVATCALLCPYAGTMFMLSGITRDLSELCSFP